MTEQPQTPPDGEATEDLGVETTQAGVAPTEDAVAPTEAEAPTATPPTEVQPPAPVAEPPLASAPPSAPPASPPVPPSDGSGSSAGLPPGHTSGPDVAAFASERPEIQIGAAFAGGFVLALILRRLAS